MNRWIKIAIVAIGALFITGIIALVGITNDSGSQQSASNDNRTTLLVPQPAPKDSNGQIIITYTDRGFTPNVYTVAANSTLRLNNRSVRVLEFASDPFGRRTDNPELNVGQLNPGETKTFYLSQKGVWSFHNVLDASEHGTLIVQ